MFLIRDAKMLKPHFGHENLSDKTFHCPYMQIFWVDKDFKYRLRATKSLKQSKRERESESGTKSRVIYKIHSTEKPQNQRKYDDRDETINFHSPKM